jgi:hypothetical protein
VRLLLFARASAVILGALTSLHSAGQVRARSGASLDPELDALRALKALRADLEIVTVASATHAGEGRVIDRSECLAALRTFLGRAANPAGGR